MDSDGTPLIFFDVFLLFTVIPFHIILFLIVIPFLPVMPRYKRSLGVALEDSRIEVGLNVQNQEITDKHGMTIYKRAAN